MNSDNNNINDYNSNNNTQQQKGVLLIILKSIMTIIRTRTVVKARLEKNRYILNVW